MPRLHGEPPPKGRAWTTPIGRMLQSGSQPAAPDDGGAAERAALRRASGFFTASGHSDTEATGTPTQPAAPEVLAASRATAAAAPAAAAPAAAGAPAAAAAPGTPTGTRHQQLHGSAAAPQASQTQTPATMIESVPAAVGEGIAAAAGSGTASDGAAAAEKPADAAIDDKRKELEQQRHRQSTWRQRLEQQQKDLNKQKQVLWEQKRAQEQAEEAWRQRNTKDLGAPIICNHPTPLILA